MTRALWNLHPGSSGRATKSRLILVAAWPQPAHAIDKISVLQGRLYFENPCSIKAVFQSASGRVSQISSTLRGPRDIAFAPQPRRQLVKFHLFITKIGTESPNLIRQGISFTMADPTVSELNELFGAGDKGLGQDVVVEMQSIMRLHNLAPQDLFFKWESYCIKMDIESTQPSYDKMRAFKQDLQDALEKSTRTQTHAKSDKHRVGATPRGGAKGSDVFGM